MSAVRHAGYLIKEENGTFQKHWCVVRDRAFIVYPFLENTEESQLSINATPIFVLPISHLSATAYALPTVTKPIPTNYSLELECAATGRKFTFYANQSVALEKWVDAIKVESSRDYVTPQDSSHGALLPPEVGSSVSSTATALGMKPTFASQFGKETLSKKYLEHIKNTKKFDVVSPEQHLRHSTSLNAETQISVQTDALSLPDVIPTVYDGDISDSLTPLSSPTPSTPPRSCRSTHQGSVDESAFSPATSLPIVERPQDFLRSSFTRQSPIPAKRGKQRRHHITNPKNPEANSKVAHHARGLRTKKRNLLDESASDASSIGTDFGSSYFYTGKNGTKTEKVPSNKQQLPQSTSSKRHTIGGLLQMESHKLKKVQKKSNFENSAAEAESKSLASRPTRHSIAPLSSLDMQINQRRSIPVRQQLASQQVIHKPEASDSESEESSSQESKNDSFPRFEHASIYQDHSLSTDDADQPLFQSRDQTNRSTNHVVEAHNSAVDSQPQPVEMEIQTTLSLARVMMDKSRLDDARRRSGKFGSRVINRVSSAVGKRSKAAEGVMSNPPPEPEKPLSGDFPVTKPSSHKNKDFAPDLLTSSNVDDELTAASVTITQGWLYKKKHMKWNKHWAVLSSDKKLYFYRDEQGVQDSNYSSFMDLQHGCNVESVSQAKSSNSFTLVANTCADALQESRTLKDQSSNPIPHGKRIHLMCKSTQEFVHWMKSFVVLNSSSSAEMLSKMAPQRTLNPIQQDETVTEQANDMNNPSHLSQLELNNNSKVTLGVHGNQNSRGIQHSSSLQNLLPPFVVNERNTQIQKSSSFSVRKRIPLLSKNKNRTQNDSLLVDKMPLEKNNVHEEMRQGGVSDQFATFKSSSNPNFSLNDKRDHDKQTGESIKEQFSISSFLQTEGVSLNLQTRIAGPKSCDALQCSPLSSMNNDEFQTSSDRRLNKIKSSICDYLESKSVCDKSVDQAVAQKRNNKKATVSKDAAAVTPRNEKESNITRSRGEAGKTSWCDNTCTDCRHNQSRTSLIKNGNSKEKLHESLDNAALQQSNLYHPCSCGDSKSEIESAVSILPFSLHSAGQNSTSSGYTSTSGSCISLGKHHSDELEILENETVLKVLDRSKFFQNFNASLDKSNLNSQSVEHRHGETHTEDNLDKGVIVLTQPNTCSPSQILSTENQSPNFIIKQTDLLHIADNSKPIITTERVCQAVHLEIDQLAFFLTSKVSNLKRSHSDSNILEPTNGRTYRMRTVRKPIPILTQVDFLEVYGSAAKRNQNAGKFKSCLSLSSYLNEMRHEKRRHSVESDWNFSSHRSDTEASSTSGSSSSFKDGSHTSSDLHGRVSRKSSESGVSDVSNKSESRTKWFGGITSYKIGHSIQKSSSKKASSKPQIFRIPASSLTSASHCGYLDRRNRKKQWDRFWCVFQDSCLYCYNSPQSDVTRDAIVLRGYEVIADVMNMSRSRFEFRLEQQGTPTLHFSTDNHQEFLLWVGSLEREFRNVPPSPTSENSDDMALKAIETNSEQTREDSIVESPNPKGLLFEEQLDQGIIEMQKHQLLKELATQQQKLLEENRLLSGVTADVITPSSPEGQLRHQKKRIEVLQKYNRQREIEETNATKSMVLLNCRRNSAQLKVDQLAREIAPKSGKKRRQDHQHFAALEAKLNEMKEKLLQVDMEIQNLQVNKQNALEKIRERQDLELLLSEQQDALAIIRRHEAESPNGGIVRRRQRSSKKTLASIDEQHSCGTSELRTSASSDSVDSESKIHPINYPQVFEDSSDEVSSSSTSSSARLNQSSSSSNKNEFESNHHDTITSSVTLLQEAEDSSSKYRVKKKDEIDPSVIAGIEDFEIFSKQILEKVHNK